jgi:hypothetical protein
MKTWTKGIITSLLMGVVIFSSLPALAGGPYAPYIDGREARLQHRMYQGLRAGRVTPGEYRRLEHQQGRIRLAEARMRADGHLDRHERARLNRMENHASRTVYQYNHNNRRPGWH